MMRTHHEKAEPEVGAAPAISAHVVYAPSWYYLAASRVGLIPLKQGVCGKSFRVTDVWHYMFTYKSCANDWVTALRAHVDGKIAPLLQTLLQRREDRHITTSPHRYLVAALLDSHRGLIAPLSSVPVLIKRKQPATPPLSTECMAPPHSTHSLTSTS